MLCCCILLDDCQNPSSKSSSNPRAHTFEQSSVQQLELLPRMVRSLTQTVDILRERHETFHSSRQLSECEVSGIRTNAKRHVATGVVEGPDQGRICFEPGYRTSVLAYISDIFGEWGKRARQPVSNVATPFRKKRGSRGQVGCNTSHA